MILFYIDESGTGLKDQQSAYFVLSAFAIPAEAWQVVDDKLATLKRNLIAWAKPEDYEIKGRDMRRGDKLFKGLSWAIRVQAMLDTAQVIAELPCKIFTVQVDKRDLPEYVEPDEQLYRLSLWRLLEEIESELEDVNQAGMLLFDMRSDLHSSVQDRRLVDAYRDWLGSRSGQCHLIELPWFGFSAFYSGLQIADFCAYLIDFVSNEVASAKGEKELHSAYSRFRDKVRLVRIP